jgi:hypothetical protein
MQGLFEKGSFRNVYSFVSFKRQRSTSSHSLAVAYSRSVCSTGYALWAVTDLGTMQINKKTVWTRSAKIQDNVSRPKYVGSGRDRLSGDKKLISLRAHNAVICETRNINSQSTMQCHHNLFLRVEDVFGAVKGADEKLMGASLTFRLAKHSPWRQL